LLPCLCCCKKHKRDQVGVDAEIEYNKDNLRSEYKTYDITENKY